MKKKDVEQLCKRLKVEAERILLAPVVQSGAPTGFVRRKLYEAEERRRLEAVDRVLEELIDEFIGDDDELMHRRR